MLLIIVDMGVTCAEDAFLAYLEEEVPTTALNLIHKNYKLRIMSERNLEAK